MFDISYRLCEPVPMLEGLRTSEPPHLHGLPHTPHYNDLVLCWSAGHAFLFRSQFCKSKTPGFLCLKTPV